MKERYEGLKAKLVWDGGDEVRIPGECGTPREDQMIGTVAERLAEVSGRACYDSMGKNGSRPSSEYHTHITGVGHGSVYGHWHRTFSLDWSSLSVEKRFALLKGVVNRPGLHLNLAHEDQLRFTTNFRTITEWPKWSAKFRKTGYYRNPLVEEASRAVQVALYKSGWKLGPQIMKALEINKRLEDVPTPTSFGSFPDSCVDVDPEDNFERWVSLYIEGSRGLTHEEVRHGYMTGISQRSTRFVDENESPWVMHPLLQEFLVSDEIPLDVRESIRILTAEAEASGKRAYAEIVEKLQPWCMKRIPESDKFRKTSARKQARGAARGYLGNGLKTLGIFSAAVDEQQWKELQRGANAADGEIRCLYTMEVLPELKHSRYRSEFAFETEPATDGVGLVLKGGGNK